MDRDGIGLKDQFPVGMRVLAVDDDPVSLKLLETLLLRCRYHVTMTSQAIIALKLLRENKDKFDLVISDVHMPNMDGFQLLELVGLEMDLPVIMLSVNGETKSVMKGISYGACDYLLKPVRIEELRNIWQHVVRRRKFDHRDHSNFESGDDFGKLQYGNCEGGPGSIVREASDHIGKFSKKRKDQNEEDENDSEDNINENENPSTQKKPRVVWSIELHRKFVAVVNQLGIDKAVPKRILDLMNVDKLTRENVASHLQKYRLYLKRLSAVASQQANTVAAFGARDTSYLHIGSLDGFGNFHALAAQGHLPALASFQPGGVLSRTSSTSLALHSLASHGVVQAGHTHNISIPIGDLGKLQVNVPGNQYGRLLQGIPTSLELQQLHPKRIQEANNHFAGGGLHAGSSNSSFVSMTNSTLTSQNHHQQTHFRGFVNHPQLELPSISSDPYQVSTGISSHLPDLSRCNDTWQGAAPLTGYTTNTLSLGAAISHDTLSKDSVSVPISLRGNNSLGISSSGATGATPHDPLIGRDLQCQAISSSGNVMFMPMRYSKLFNYNSSEVSGNVMFLPMRDLKLFNYNRSGNFRQKFEEPNQAHLHEDGLMSSSFSSSTLSNNFMIDPDSGNKGISKHNHIEEVDKSMIPSACASSLILAQNCKIGESTMDSLLKHKELLSEMSKLQGGSISGGCSLNDFVP